MRLQWIMLAMATTLLSGCINEDVKQQPTVPTNVPTQDVLGAEPHYEPYHPTANNDYQRNGKQYQIVREPAQFSQVGYASIYGQEASGQLTAIGERANPVELTAAHPTLPIPSYARITNMMNGRMMVVRINDRGPYTPGKSIAVSRAVADRLNLMTTTKIKIDAIQVAPDGSLSGPGTVGSNFVKQSYAPAGSSTIRFRSIRYTGDARIPSAKQRITSKTACGTYATNDARYEHQAARTTSCTESH